VVGTGWNRVAPPCVGMPEMSRGVLRNQPTRDTFERTLLHTLQRRVLPVTRVLKLTAAATGAAVIAIAAFLLHPRSGARRRAAARRATVGVATLVGSAVDKRPRRTGANSWDETLADRVRVALTMGFGDLATGLEIRANRGVVTLRGEVDELTDITRFETAVREVGDVVDVDNLLRLRMRDMRPHVLSA
jgi:osmotically-inducible protein OsmY